MSYAYSDRINHVIYITVCWWAVKVAIDFLPISALICWKQEQERATRSCWKRHTRHTRCTFTMKGWTAMTLIPKASRNEVRPRDPMQNPLEDDTQELIWLSRKASTKPILIELATQSVIFFQREISPVYTLKSGNFCVEKARTRGTKREIRGFEVDVLLCHFVSYT